MLKGKKFDAFALFRDLECPFRDFECPFKAFERRIYCGSTKFSLWFNDFS